MTNLESDRLLLPDWLDVAARSNPDRLALSFGGERWTYAALRQAVDSSAAVIAHRRRGRAGRVGILAANRAGYVFAVHAARWLGVPFVPLNWRQTADELAGQMRDAEMGLLFADEERMALATAASAEFPVAVVAIEELEHAPAGDARSHEHLVDLGAEAAVFFTSGTSGRAKGARLTNGNLWFSAVASALHLGHHDDDVWLATMPLFHIGGVSILIRAAIGATPVILHKRFDPARALEAIDDGATLVSLVPTMLQRMLAERGDRPWPSTLRRVLLGGAATPPDLIDACVKRGIPAAPTYGLTETASQVTTLRPADLARKPRSSGLPLPTTRVRIAREPGGRAADEPGEIEVCGPTVFAGYLGSVAERGGRTGDGWFRTGDAGYLDDEGFLHVVDRRDDLIVSGGENIYPAEVERVLLEHQHVVDAGVTGIPDEQWGARPVAGVVWRGDASAAEALLREHCAARLARYKIPVNVLVFDTLPRSSSGKLPRRRLKEMILERLDVDGSDES
jgi:O-succinylbenzoic acid--CoA ligase